MADAKFEYPLGLELVSGNALWDANLISVWKMNRNWLDSKGSNDGVRSGTGTTFDTTNQKLGSAAGKFNGTDDAVNFGNEASLQFTTAFSVSVWFKATSWDSFTPLIVKTDSGFANGWAVYWSSNELRFVINSATNKAYVAAFTDTTSWHHLVVTYDGTTLRIYLDNVEGTSDTLSGSVTDNTNDVKIGFQSGGAYFDGLLDEIAIFDRLLSPSEISTLYTQYITPVTITISNFEEPPLERIPERSQSMQVTPGGAIKVQDLAKSITYIKVNTSLLSKTDYDNLYAFFQDTVNFMENTFTFTDELSTAYSNARLSKPSFYLPRITNNSDAMYKGSFLIKTDPA